MQSAFLRGTNEKVFAWDFARLEFKQFECTGCSATMYLRNGMVRVAHFAHAPDSVCRFATNESEEQVLYKMSIYKALSERYAGKATTVDLEYTGIPDCLPAVMINGRKHRIAIEVLVDATDVRDIIDHTESYFDNNIGVIWVLPFDGARLHSGRFKMKEYEKLLYFMYNKKLLFWHRREQSFTIAEFSPIYSDSAEFYDKNHGSMVYYDGKKLRNTFQVDEMIEDIFPEDLKRWYSPKRFEMQTYKYFLPKSILWKHQPTK